METSKYSLSELDNTSFEWFTKVAAVRMLSEEYKEPRLVNQKRIDELCHMMGQSKTAWVVKHNEIPIGALGALPVPHVFNPDITCLAEIFWYVLPEYRNGRAASLLLNRFCEESKNYDESCFSLLVESEAVSKSLKKRGFMLKELGFKK